MVLIDVRFSGRKNIYNGDKILMVLLARRFYQKTPKTLNTDEFISYVIIFQGKKTKNNQTFNIPLILRDSQRNLQTLNIH